MCQQKWSLPWLSFLTNARFDYNIQEDQPLAVLTLEKIHEKYSPISPLPRLLGALYPSEITDGMFRSPGGRNKVLKKFWPGLLDATARCCVLITPRVCTTNRGITVWLRGVVMWPGQQCTLVWQATPPTISDVGDANQGVAPACQGMGLTFPQVTTNDHQNLPLWLPLIHLVATTLRIDLIASRKMYSVAKMVCYAANSWLGLAKSLVHSLELLNSKQQVSLTTCMYLQYTVSIAICPQVCSVSNWCTSGL